jgi:hypothetical protein
VDTSVGVGEAPGKASEVGVRVGVPVTTGVGLAVVTDVA